MKKYREILLTLCLVSALFAFYYGRFIHHPGSWLTTSSSDGIKAYAVFAGHIVNDTDYTNYRNMNYPYGQVHVFTDGQTIIADILKFLSGPFPFFATHAIAIYNLLMMLSFAGCAFFICLILQKLRLPSWFVIIGSVGITMMSPQIFRLAGHPTLSYAVFFPLSWWLLIRFHETRQRAMLTSCIILNSTFWFFVHPYYIMINTVFYTGYYLVLAVQEGRTFLRRKAAILHALLQVALPLIVTRSYVLMVDQHPARSEFPFGFWSYYAKLNTVFAPVNKPFRHVFQYLFNYNDSNQNWEGWAYIGLPAVIVFLYSIFRIVRYLLQPNVRGLVRPVSHSVLRAAVWSSVFALVFSMCLPFRFFAGELYDKLAFLQQFRSVGRFAWIFYYVFSVYSLYLIFLIYRKMQMQGRRAIAWVLATVTLSFYFVEGHAYHVMISKGIFQTPNVFNRKFLAADDNALIDTVIVLREHYQCIIPLPYFNVGNENFTTMESEHMLLHSFVLSHHANIPLLANSAARSPIEEGRRNMQFFTPPVAEKDIQSDLHDKRPFLLLTAGERPGASDTYWIGRSRRLYSNNTYSLYELPYDSVFKSEANEFMLHFREDRLKMRAYHGLLVNEWPDTIVFADFDTLKSPVVFRGKGALSGRKKFFVHVFERRKCFLKKDRDYLLSFWYYNRGERRNQVDCILEEVTANGSLSWSISASPTNSMKIIGDWSLVEKPFRISPGTEEISLFFKGDDLSRQVFYADDVMIRPAGISVAYSTDPSSPAYPKDMAYSHCMAGPVFSAEVLKEQRLTEIIQAIRNTPEWLKKVQAKAMDRKISLDSMLYLDAQYMYEEEQKK